MKYDDPNLRFARKAVFSISTIVEIETAGLSVMMAGFGRKVLTGNKLEEFVACVKELLRIPKKSVPILEKAARNLVGTKLTEPVLHKWLLRFAGNMDLVRLKKVPGPWVRQQYGEWVPVKIIHVAVEGNTVTLQARICAGRPAGLTAVCRWDLIKCKRMAWHNLGFSRPRMDVTKPDKYPYRSPYELMNMWFMGLVDPDRSEEAPVLAGFADCPSSLRSLNVALLKKRIRQKGVFECPRKYRLSMACFRCPAGLNECPAACRMQTLEEPNVGSNSQNMA